MQHPIQVMVKELFTFNYVLLKSVRATGFSIRDEIYDDIFLSFFLSLLDYHFHNNIRRNHHPVPDI